MEPQPDYSFGGPCVPDAPSSGIVGNAAVSLAVVPSPVGYGVAFSRELSIRNVGVEEIRIEPQTLYCVEQVWLRAAEPLHERVCTSSSFHLAVGGETVHGEAGLFRSSGPGLPTPEEHGVRADPGTYCAVAMFRLAGDSLLLETPFELLSQ